MPASFAFHFWRMSKSSTNDSKLILLNARMDSNSTRQPPLHMGHTADHQVLLRKFKIPTLLRPVPPPLLQRHQGPPLHQAVPRTTHRNIHNTMAIKPRVLEALAVKLIHTQRGVDNKTMWLTISITCNSSKDRVLAQRLRHQAVGASSHLHRRQVMVRMVAVTIQCRHRLECDSNSSRPRVTSLQKGAGRTFPCPNISKHIYPMHF